LEDYYKKICKITTDFFGALEIKEKDSNGLILNNSITQDQVKEKLKVHQNELYIKLTKLYEQKKIYKNNNPEVNIIQIGINWMRILI
jgi:hypothetical protein